MGLLEGFPMLKRNIIWEVFPTPRERKASIDVLEAGLRGFLSK
jgi:hypothetical protein